MTFPSYPAYKDSGVEWLGEVPEHWQIKALRYLSVCLDGKRIPLNGEQRADKQGDIPYWGANAVMDYVDEAIFDEELLLVGEDGAPFLDPLKPVAFHSSGPVWPNNHIHVLRPNRPEWVRFLVYAMNSADYANYIEGSTRQKLNQSRLMGMPVSWPSYEEQTQIARFLDHETARIDALIAEQQRLIELLKEKRQAVISHAVTKGLDPTVPMKDSGVEWLGEVPAHWEVKRLRYLLKANGLIRGPFGGDLKKEIFVERGVKVYEQKNAIYRDFSLGNSFITQDKFSEMRRFEVKAGDYIMSCSGTIGRAYRIPEEAPVGIINQALLVIRFSEELGFEFADWIFVADFFANQIIDNSQGGAMKNLVGMDVFTSISMPVPSVQEQLSIAKYLRDEVSRIDALISAAGQAVNLMQERRAALISAAVTGKIDVRGWQPPASTQTPEFEVAEAH